MYLVAIDELHKNKKNKTVFINPDHVIGIKKADPRHKRKNDFATSLIFFTDGSYIVTAETPDQLKTKLCQRYGFRESE